MPCKLYLVCNHIPLLVLHFRSNSKCVFVWICILIKKFPFLVLFYHLLLLFSIPSGWEHCILYFEGLSCFCSESSSTQDLLRSFLCPISFKLPATWVFWNMKARIFVTMVKSAGGQLHFTDYRSEQLSYAENMLPEFNDNFKGGCTCISYGCCQWFVDQTSSWGCDWRN